MSISKKVSTESLCIWKLNGLQKDPWSAKKSQRKFKIEYLHDLWVGKFFLTRQDKLRERHKLDYSKIVTSSSKGIIYSEEAKHRLEDIYIYGRIYLKSLTSC